MEGIVLRISKEKSWIYFNQLLNIKISCQVRIPSNQIINNLNRCITTSASSTFDSLKEAKGKLNPWFVTGITDAEGCFIITIYKRPSLNIGFMAGVRFSLSLHKKDIALLQQIQAHYGFGRIFTVPATEYSPATLLYQTIGEYGTSMILNQLLTGTLPSFLFTSIFLKNFTVSPNSANENDAANPMHPSPKQSRSHQQQPKGKALTRNFSSISLAANAEHPMHPDYITGFGDGNSLPS